MKYWKRVTFGRRKGSDRIEADCMYGNVGSIFGSCRYYENVTDASLGRLTRLANWAIKQENEVVGSLYSYGFTSWGFTIKRG